MAQEDGEVGVASATSPLYIWGTQWGQDFLGVPGQSQTQNLRN